MSFYLALAMRILRGGDRMADTQTEPTVATVTEALLLALPDWRRHYHRCPTGSRCRAEHGEWVDVLLEELAALSTPTH